MARRPPTDPEQDDRFPHDLDAERALLGALMLHPERFSDVADSLAADDFYREAHRCIYRAMFRIMQRREAPDLVAVRAELARSGEADAAGGTAYLASLLDGTSRTAIDSAAVVVHDRALRRSLIRAAIELLTAAREDESGAVALDRAEEAVYKLAARVTGERLVTGEMLQRVLLDVLERIQTTGKVSGVETGFLDLDDATRGLHPGQLVLVAARPGQGKSAFALNVAEHVSSHYDGDVPFFSLEMDHEEIGTRRVSIRSRVSNHDLLSGVMRDADHGKVAMALGGIGASRIVIDDEAERTVAQIRSIARRIKAQRGVSLVVVDYLQLLTPPRHMLGKASRQEQVADFGRKLKLLAKELRVPVMALSQLSRASEDRKGKRPQLSDLRESGALEQDADVVLFVHPPERANGRADIIIGKQRNGPRTTVHLAYDPAAFWFGNLSDADGTPASGPVDDEE